MTFSLLARDAESGRLGVASQSHYLGVGAVVTWAQAGVGVVATQAFALRAHGPRGLELLRAGASAEEALAQLVASDPDPDVRQLGIVDADGGVAAHDGARCVGAAGVAAGDGVLALGNMLDNDGVPQALLDGFTAAEGDLSHRLVAGLRAADDAGGDVRGRQSAALLVVGGERCAEPSDGVVRDLRVEDAPDPIAELARLAGLSDAVDAMSAVVFDPGGPILGARAGQSDAAFRAAAATLARSDAALGANPEARYWSAVLHARWGRFPEARRLLASARSDNPRLSTFFVRMVAAGILTRDEADQVLG